MRSGCIVVFCAAAAVGGAPAIARACSNFANVSSTVPAGGEHPANAAVLLHGFVPFDFVTATVDGVPVTIVRDEALSVSGSIQESNYWRVLALRFEPEPLAGQTVVVDGVPCEDGPDFCPPYHIEYVAGEPDLEIADDITTVSFDLLRFTSIYQTSCGNYGSVVATHVDIGDDAWADESFVMLEVRAFHAGLGIEDVRRRIAVPSSAWHYLDTAIIGDAFPLDGWCVEVTPRDAAGNEGPVVSSCDACMFAEAEGGTESPPLVPIPGGPCDVSSTTSSGGDPGTTGGAATTTTSDASSSDSGDPPPDSDPPSDDDTAPPEDDDDTSGPPAQDDGVSDRGCACRSSASPSPFALLLLGLLGLERRRTSSRAS